MTTTSAHLFEERPARVRAARVLVAETVQTPGGPVVANPGDWIVEAPLGTFNVLGPVAFRLQYQPADRSRSDRLGPTGVLG